MDKNKMAFMDLLDGNEKLLCDRSTTYILYDTILLLLLGGGVGSLSSSCSQVTHEKESTLQMVGRVRYLHDIGQYKNSRVDRFFPQ